MPEVASQIRIAQADIARFAALSGDFNPLHVDAIAARRLLFGSTVPYGVHVLLAALAAQFTGESAPLSLASLRVNFAAPAMPEAALIVETERSMIGESLITVRHEGKLLQSITAIFVAALPDLGDTIPDQAHTPSRPRELALNEAADWIGAVPLAVDRALLGALFPSLAGRLPIGQIAVLLAATRIVGMECPGLHSIFGGLELVFTEGPPAAPAILEFRIERVEPRMSLVRLAVEGGGSAGRLTAFFRPPPVVQSSAAEIALRLVRGEFAGRRPLIIGGSRGIGEIVAKLLAMGGAETWITYARGTTDAAAVAADIRAAGGQCDSFQFDVTDPPSVLAAGRPPRDWWPSHLYYFATPSIQLTRGGAWDRALFGKYCAYYLDGMVASLTALEKLFARDGAPLALFYPSTVFLDQPQHGAAEYSAAKAAGEALCQALGASRPWLHVRCARLPRLKTDQTNSLQRGAEAGDPVALLLGILREAEPPSQRVGLELDAVDIAVADRDVPAVEIDLAHRAVRRKIDGDGIAARGKRRPEEVGHRLCGCALRHEAEGAEHRAERPVRAVEIEQHRIAILAGLPDRRQRGRRFRPAKAPFQQTDDARVRAHHGLNPIDREGLLAADDLVVVLRDIDVTPVEIAPGAADMAGDIVEMRKVEFILGCNPRDAGEKRRRFDPLNHRRGPLQNGAIALRTEAQHDSDLCRIDCRPPTRHRGKAGDAQEACQRAGLVVEAEQEAVVDEFHEAAE
jgi:hypothetical protein